MTILKNAKKLSEEDLKQVTGGGIFLADKNGRVETWEIINDLTGATMDRISVNLDNANGYNTASALARQHGQGNYWYSWKEIEKKRLMYSN